MTPIQQRRKPAQRAFTGMVGMPAEAAPVAAAEPVAQAPKRGRPMKGERPMTSAERKARSRADRERRGLVAWYIKTVRRGLPDIIGFGEPRDKDRAKQRQWMRQLGDDLLTLSIEDLRNAVTMLKEVPDLKGRLHNERSGEDDRKYGTSELERIIAAQDRDADGHRRVTPESHGPDSFEQDDSDEVDLRKPESSCRIPSGYFEWLNEKDEVMSELVTKFYAGQQCKLCGAVIPDPSDARQHFWVEYENGWKLYEHYEKLSDPELRDIVPETLINEARNNYNSHGHLQAVWLQLRDRKRSTKPIS